MAPKRRVEKSRPRVIVPTTSPDDLRLGHLLGRDVQPDSQPVLSFIGFPVDEGVRRNGGRIGAALAPDEIRQSLFRMSPDPGSEIFASLLRRTRDWGNLKATGKLEGDQENLGLVVCSFLAKGTIPVILGGGHETAYGHFLGYVKAGRDVSILNWDAHADVRELLPGGRGNSGTPFRQALLHPERRCREYLVAGLLPYSVSRSHLDFVTAHGQYFWRSALTRRLIDEIYYSLKGRTMVTFDMDVVDQSHAPGVSAPAGDGLTADLWLYAAYRAGRCPVVTSIDLVEVNPDLDRDRQTSRLAAVTLWYFFKGLTERLQAADSR
jgi:formiminoglutamase